MKLLHGAIGNGRILAGYEHLGKALRSGAAHVLTGALLAALDSGARIAARLGRTAEQELWQRKADEVHPELLRRAKDSPASVLYASGEMLGNFPQAYTHVGLINAAITIGLLKAARDERIAPWQF